METGVVYYDELVIDRPVQEVFPALLHFSIWNPEHATAKHTLLKGKPGEVGEVFEVLKAYEGAKPYIAETVRIRPLTKISGPHLVGNVVWKVYPKEGCAGYSFVDFGVREFNGKTLIYKSYYAQSPWTDAELTKIRQMQMQEKENWLRKSSIKLKEYMEKN